MQRIQAVRLAFYNNSIIPQVCIPFEIVVVSCVIYDGLWNPSPLLYILRVLLTEMIRTRPMTVSVSMLALYPSGGDILP